MAPAGTPKKILGKLHAEMHKVLTHPEVKALWTKQGVTPIDVSQAEFEKFLRDDIEKWANVVKLTGFKLN